MNRDKCIRFVDNLHADEALQALDEAAALLRAGRLVAFPTETVYGLGASALDAAAVRRIFAAKGRPSTNPLIVHVRSIEHARTLAGGWPMLATRLAEHFWPGPLTLVVPKAEHVPDIVTAGGPTIALRMPDHPVASALLERCGLALAAPSANRSTRISPTTAAHVVKELAGRVDLVLDAGPTAGGLESTVFDIATTRILRPGLVTAEQLAAVLGEPVTSAPEEPRTQAIARSPGLMRRHYAPSVPVELVGDAPARLQRLADEGQRVGWLQLAGENATAPAAATIELPREAAAYSARLYAALHELEDAGIERIVISRPPTGPAWEAIHDRLRRATAQADE